MPTHRRQPVRHHGAAGRRGRPRPDVAAVPLAGDPAAAHRRRSARPTSRRRRTSFGARPPYPLLADRPDVLVFQTPPLAEPVEVTGPIVVKLWISSSARDTDFTAKLIDVYPPNADYPEGYHMNLVDSVIRTPLPRRLGARGADEAGRGLPGRDPTCRRPATCSPPGTASGSTSPAATSRASTSTRTPASRWAGTRGLVRAEQVVYVERERPSQVVLPTIPFK